MAKAAYCAGEAMYSEYDGEWKQPHSDPSRVVYREVLLPPNAPREFADSQTLWNAVDAAEYKRNAQTARQFVIALPRELTFEQNKDLIREYCQKDFVEKGMVVDLYYHDDQGGNPHVHLLVTVRAMDEKGRWLSKSKTVPVLDENGNTIRYPNGRCKRMTVPTVDWNDHKYGEIWRNDWGEMQNAALEKAGSDRRIDMRSLKRQGITDRVPQVHMGPASSAMERKGIFTEVGDQNRKIQETNQELSGLKRIYSSLKNWFQTLADTIRDIKTVEEPDKDNLVSALLAYHNLRKVERESWSGYQQRRGDIDDLTDFSRVIAFLQENDLHSINKLGVLLNSTGTCLNELNNTVRRNTRRIRDIHDLLEAVDAVKQLAPIEEELKTKRFGRDKFLAAHKDDLNRLAKKRYLIDKLSQGGKIDRKALLAESQKLQDEIETMRPDIEQAKSELDQLKKIRYMVRKVIPDALPSPKQDDKQLMSEQLEVGANEAELKKITDRAAEHVLSQNPMKQQSVIAEHHHDHNRKQE